MPATTSSPARRWCRRRTLVWSSERHGAQGINCPLCRVSEASMPAAPSGTQVIPHHAGPFGDKSQSRGPAPDGSPPGPLEAAVGAAGAVEPVQRPPVLVGKLEVEDLRVLLDTLAVRGLRQHDEVALERPADKDLGWRASQALGEAGHPPVAE